MKNDLILRLYHGRKDPNERLEDWGFDGPVIGPISGIVSTYGTIRIFHSGNELVELSYHEDMVVLEECYYGDMEIVSIDNIKENGWSLTHPKEFRKKTEKPQEQKPGTRQSNLFEKL